MDHPPRRTCGGTVSIVPASGKKTSGPPREDIAISKFSKTKNAQKHRENEAKHEKRKFRRYLRIAGRIRTNGGHHENQRVRKPRKLQKKNAIGPEIAKIDF